MSNFNENFREHPLLLRAAAWRDLPELDDFTAAAMRNVTQRHGIDFATALLYDRLRKCKRHSAAILAFEATEHVHTLPAGRLPSLLAIVPGAFYREMKHTGADGQVIREEAARLGIASELIPVDSFGSLETNSRIVRNWLLNHQQDNLVLISLSKGGAEVKRALEYDDAPQQLRNVAAWVNLSGITEFSPLADWLLKHTLRSQLVRLWFWWRGYDFHVVKEYAQPRAAAWRLPAATRVIHVVGFPLSEHLSTPLARRGHRRLANLGPNDAGGNVLADVVRWPGEILPLWGADHYLQPGQEAPGQLIIRILNYLYDSPAVANNHVALTGVTL